AEGRMRQGLPGITSYAVKSGAPVDIDGDQIQQAFDWGLLSAKLAQFNHSAASADVAATTPLRSGADLTAYLKAMTDGGKSPECGVVDGIVGGEGLPKAERAALKGPLTAALAPLAPKSGEKVEFKINGQKTISMPSVASGAQSCRELEDLFAELSRGAARMRE